MDKSEKIVVRTAAFLISTVISISLFALFSEWAWIQLDPAQQEVIAATSAPWFSARHEPATPVSVAGAEAGDVAPDYRTVTARVARKR